MKIKLFGNKDLISSVHVNYDEWYEQIDVIIDVKHRSYECSYQGASSCPDIDYKNSIAFYIFNPENEDDCEVILIAESEVEYEIISGMRSVSICKGQFIFYFMKFDDYQIRHDRMVLLDEFTNYE